MADGGQPGRDAGTHRVVQAYHQAWQRRDVAAIVALYHPEIEYHDLLQNRILRRGELETYVRASLPAGDGGRLVHSDRIRVDGDTAFIQYQLALGGHGACFRSSEAIRVRDGLIFSIHEYAVLQQATAPPAAERGSALRKLGLSARQIGRMADDLQQYFARQRPFLDPHCALPAIAAATGYSRNQLSYLLNQVLGRSFYRYVNEARVEYLLTLLASAPAAARIDTLAFAAGFSSLSACYRAFRQATGTTPGDWLRRLSCGSAATTARDRRD